MSALEAIPAEIRQNGLRFVHDSEPGFKRNSIKDEFVYTDLSGKRITDATTLQRISSLAIPPAYTDVWICENERGHLQATGRDARGRKQYRYHPKFREGRDAHKFGHLIDFAKALPMIHSRINHDLSKTGFPKDKVVAVIVSLLEKTFIRVGNDEYRKMNHSFGLTTLFNRHVHVEGSELTFCFLGKSKVNHSITLKDRKISNAVKKLQDLPGQILFQYETGDGKLHPVTSHDVNDYLNSITRAHFTAKDFRTWAGTVLAIIELSTEEVPTSKTRLNRTVNHAVKVVATQLGNTPSVCRKCYIHPGVLASFEDGSLHKLLRKKDNLEEPEKLVIKLLKTYSLKDSSPPINPVTSLPTLRKGRK